MPRLLIITCSLLSAVTHCNSLLHGIIRGLGCNDITLLSALALCGFLLYDIIWCLAAMMLLWAYETLRKQIPIRWCRNVWCRLYLQSIWLQFLFTAACSSISSYSKACTCSCNKGSGVPYAGEDSCYTCTVFALYIFTSPLCLRAFLNCTSSPLPSALVLSGTVHQALTLTLTTTLTP